MRLLAVDTSTLSCGVAVLGEDGLVSEGLFSSKRTHSRHLLGMIEETLARAELTVMDLDGFAVTRGPGSFTGLRIGMSVIKGLAEVSEKPVVGVSSLACLAQGALLAGKPVLSMLDARKGEVYAALYAPDGKGGVTEMLSPEAIAPEVLLARMEGDLLCVGTGAVAYASQIKAMLGVHAHFAPEYDTIRPHVVASMALEAFKQGEEMTPEALTPLYLRKSDAEIALALRSASNGHS